MTSERTHAYGRVVKTLDDLGPTKLQPGELERVRDAADTLIFAAHPEEIRPGPRRRPGARRAPGRERPLDRGARRGAPARHRGLRARRARRLTRRPAQRLRAARRASQSGSVRERGALAEVLRVLAIERPRVAGRLLGGPVALGPARAAAAPAGPAHLGSLAAEAPAMTHDAAGEHALSVAAWFGLRPRPGNVLP